MPGSQTNAEPRSVRILHGKIRSMPLNLDDDRRKLLVSRLQAFHETEFDEDLSVFRAERLLEFLLALLGPQVYNQAVQDARVFMQRKLDDLDGEVYQPEIF